MDEIEVPTDLGALSTEDLAALEGRLVDATRDAVIRGEADSDTARNQAIALEAVTMEINRREDVDGLRTDLAAEIREQVLAELREELSVSLEDEGGEAPVDEAEDEGDGDGEADDTEADAEEAPEAPSASELAANDPVPTITVHEGNRSLTLLRGVGTRMAGEELENSVQLAEALHEIARTMADGTRGLKVARYDTAPTVQLGNDPVENAALIDAVIAERTEGGAEGLVASGGWITPSEISYSFFQPETTDGMIDLPTVGVSRGGLRVITNGGPTIADAIAATDAHWVWDEDTDIDPDGATKTRYKIPAPTWTDVRLAAYGVALDHGNLAARSFPELTARWLRLAPIAHEHEVNRIFIAAIATASTAVDLSTGFTAGGFAGTILDAVALQGALIHQKYKMSMGATLEAVFPFWVKEAIRSDLSRRSGQALLDVSDADISSWFTIRNIRPQYVYDWQAIPASNKAWEATNGVGEVDFLLYPAGQWVQGRGGSLDLGLHRDSTLNETNDHTALWTEQFLSLMKMGPESRKVTVTVDVNGFTGGSYSADGS